MPGRSKVKGREMSKAICEPLQPDRLETLVLHAGGHTDRRDGLCAMEVVAWIAGEKHSAEPQCACPVLSAFMRSWNDAIPDDARRTELLKPLLPRLVGTKSTKRVEQRRADLALDWLVRVQTAAWLDLAKLSAEAETLRKLPALLDRAAVLAARPALERARERAAAAWAAAWDAARAAAWAAAADAAWAAAGAAAWAAARAAARDAARDAAWDAAWDAARDAARTALQPTVEALQVSALDLIDRMIAVRDEDLAEAS